MISRLATILESSVVEVPFSVAVNGKSLERSRKLECSICLKCPHRSCHVDTVVGVKICDLGVRFHVYQVQEDQVVVYGLAPHSDFPKRLKEAFKGRRFPNAVVEAWINRVEEFCHLLEAGAESARSEALDSIHDVSKLAGEVASIANQLYGEDLTQISRLELSLVKSAELLVKEFERIELLINPGSAATGRIYSHVYKLCHKYAQIVDLAFAKPNNKRVRMAGRSFLELRVFESISVLVFSLIENATKYAMSGETIDVELNDRIGAVDLAVVSIGPLIEASEISRLFERGFRGKWAQKTQVDGRGMGLYLAKLVADAHRTNIGVSSVPQGYERNSIPCARNTFTVRISNV